MAKWLTLCPLSFLTIIKGDNCLTISAGQIAPKHLLSLSSLEGERRKKRNTPTFVTMQGKAQKRSPAAVHNSGRNKNESGNQKVGGVKVGNEQHKNSTVDFGHQNVEGGICNNNAGTNYGGNKIKEGSNVYYPCS